MLIAKRSAQDDGPDEIAGPVPGGFQFAGHAFHGSLVAVYQAAPQGIPKGFAHEVAEEHVAALEEYLPKLAWPLEAFTGGKSSLDVERLPLVFFAPAAEEIEIELSSSTNL